MKTLLEKLEEEKKRQAEKDYLARIKTVIPFLSPCPLVKTPLSCRLGFHKDRYLSHVPRSHHEIWVCLKCGRVKAGWGYVSLLGGNEFFETVGYVDPEKPLKLRRPQNEKRVKDEIIELGKTGDRRIALEQCLKWIDEARKQFPNPQDYAHERFEELTPEMIMNGFFNAHTYIYDVQEWFKKWFGEENYVRGNWI